MSNVTDLIVRAWVAIQTWHTTTFQDEDRGQGMVEYALILALVAVVAIIILVVLGQRVTNTFNNAATAIGNR